MLLYHNALCANPAISISDAERSNRSESVVNPDAVKLTAMRAYVCFAGDYFWRFTLQVALSLSCVLFVFAVWR